METLGVFVIKVSKLVEGRLSTHCRHSGLYTIISQNQKSGY